jgi:predicted dehydrogenase
MTIRAGVIGTGYLGRLHARVLTEIPGVDVVGFVEPDDKVAADVEEALKLKRFSTIGAISKELDCAIVATPTTTHFEIAKLLLESGCDVLIEKPVTATVEEARALVEIAAATKRIVQVGHVERYNPAIAAIADLVRGTRYFESQRLGVFVPRSLDVDVLLDLMIHDLNLVVSLLRQKVVEIRAVGVPVLTEKVDITNVRLSLENGAVANLTASRVSQERIRKQRFFGSDFYISVDTKEQEARGYRLVDDDGLRTLRPFELTVVKKEPLRAENEAFLKCVHDRTRPIVSAEDGLAAVELAIRVREAIETAVQSYHPTL